jgi:hypothetical protein
MELLFLIARLGDLCELYLENLGTCLHNASIQMGSTHQLARNRARRLRIEKIIVGPHETKSASSLRLLKSRDLL